MSSYRSLPRVFIAGATAEAPFELPQEELDKLRKVLRLSSGAELGVLPNDGTMIRCELQGREAIPLEVTTPSTEPALRLTLAQALPKGDKLDDIVKACTGLGVARFVLFPSERTVVQWDAKKMSHRLLRLQTIAREEAEVCFRTRLPEFETAKNLAEVLQRYPEATVLSEVEGVARRLEPPVSTIVVGPEGGWSRKELDLIGSRGVTIGPRVLRVEHAAAAAAALVLLHT
ncbi:MAG TPA: RsmE family RNA methyltransferase [Fimbriimonas sp.]|nr:RsmE family RNA methyltransferase [Fimbriimonas sp.]